MFAGRQLRIKKAMNSLLGHREMTRKGQDTPTTTEEQLVCAASTVKKQRRRLKGESEAQDARRWSFICWCAAHTSGGISSLPETRCSLLVFALFLWQFAV